MATHDGAGVGKGYSNPEYGKDVEYTAEPFVHGHTTVAEATGRGGDTHRGLKSRHIQFLYVLMSVVFFVPLRHMKSLSISVLV
jgi:amino acid transporter